MNIKHLIVIGSAFLSAFAAQAATCTWSGGTWSGGTWDVAPQSGDAIVIDNATAGAMFNVDVGSVNISSLTFKSGGKQCYVVGGTINISGNYAITANHTMTISNNLALANSAPRLDAASGRSYYYGDITLTYATGDLRVYGAGGNTFYGKVTIPRDLLPGS